MANLGKIVVVSGLISNFQREPFENMTNLISKAEKFTKLSSICMICAEKAAFHKKIQPELCQTPQDFIGGTDKYKSVCRKCFNEKM